MGVEITRSPNVPDIAPRAMSPLFSDEAIKKSVEKEFAAIVEPGASGAAVALVTAQGVKVAVAQRIGEHWRVVVQGGMDWKGHMDGQVKVLAQW